MPPASAGTPPSSAPRKLRRVLPADIVLDATRRLGIASLSMGAALVVLVAERTRGYAYSRVWLGLDLLCAAASLGLAFVCRRGLMGRGWLPTVANGYQLLLAFTLSFMEFSVPGGAMKVREGGISWACLVIVLFPALVPSPPGRALATGIAAATMGPLAYGLALSLGLEPNPLPLFDARLLFLDNYIAGVLALVPSIAFTRLTDHVAEARDVGSYTLEERLGVGGMGEVWKARHRLLARPAAVKLIPPAAFGPGREADAVNTLARFEREARTTASLRSPHTVGLYDFGPSDDGSFYYVMELLEGVTVESLVEQFGPLPPSRAIALLTQVCKSLEEAHQHGLVHRDVKPANIFVCRLGTEYDFVKVLDFGLVKTLADDGPDAVRLSATDMVYGTPAYMAPEQARGEAITPLADVYALGCVAYYMLAGLLVFDSRATTQILIDQVQRLPLPPSRRSGAAIPPALEALVMECLEKAPERRPPSAQAVAERLTELAAAHPWTAADAESWWAENLPALVPGGGALSTRVRS